MLILFAVINWASSQRLFSISGKRYIILLRYILTSNSSDFKEVRILTDFYASLELSVRSQLTESGLYMGEFLTR